MCNPIAHILLNSESMCNSIAHIYVVMGSYKKEKASDINSFILT